MNLTDKNLFGKSNTYIELARKVLRKMNQASQGSQPHHQLDFYFYVRPGKDKLYVKAVDKDPLINDKIGDTTISLNTCFGERPVLSANITKRNRSLGTRKEDDLLNSTDSIDLLRCVDTKLTRPFRDTFTGMDFGVPETDKQMRDTDLGSSIWPLSSTESLAAIS
ncbi:MAG: hypothetical protein JOS17DRAFT_817876 [Linnemannia elongata]|nr:MAG: hypothetical protein JOS17DRAFT_817876 [Linnemannia elongata]